MNPARDLIQIAIQDSQYPVEVRSRLNTIYEDEVSKLDRKKVELAQDSSLQENPEYLIWLWEQLAAKTELDSTTQQQLIAAQLAKVTRQQFGDDLSRWKKWLEDASVNSGEESRDSEVSAKSLADCFLQELGPIDSVDEYLGQMLRIKLVGRELVLDREHWAAEFGDKTIKQSSDEVVELLKQRNLPVDWFKPGGDYAPDSVGFPQVIFENLVSRLEVPASSSNVRRVYYSGGNQTKNTSLNRRSVSPTTEVGLEFHEPSSQDLQQMRFGGLIQGNAGQDPKETYFLFYIRETTSPFRSLEFRESNRGVITIELLSEASDAILRLVQLPPAEGQPATNRLQMLEIRDGKLTVFDGPDFKSVIDEHRDYLVNEWLPVFEKIGVQFSIGDGSAED